MQQNYDAAPVPYPDQHRQFPFVQKNTICGETGFSERKKTQSLSNKYFFIKYAAVKRSAKMVQEKDTAQGVKKRKPETGIHQASNPGKFYAS